MIDAFRYPNVVDPEGVEGMKRPDVPVPIARQSTPGYVEEES